MAEVTVPLERRVPARSLLRVASVGLLSLGLALVAHVLSGGAVPAPAILAGLAALTVLGATLVSRFRMPFWLLMVLIGLSQQLLHLAFDAFAVSFVAGEAGGLQVHHDEPELPAAVSTGHGGHSDEAMMMVHLHMAAVLLTALAVSKTDAALSRLGRLVARPAAS
jgi:hypothetical protein